MTRPMKERQESCSWNILFELGS